MIRLCDAIRKGCEGTRQDYESFGSLEQGSCCATGAARIILGGHSFIYEMHPTLQILVDSPPVNMEVPLYKRHCNHIKTNGKHPVFAVINHMNDCLHISREAIADWIEREFESSARLTEPESKDELVLQEVAVEQSY